MLWGIGRCETATSANRAPADFTLGSPLGPPHATPCSTAMGATRCRCCPRQTAHPPAAACLRSLLATLLAAAGCSRLQQAAAGCSRLQRAAAGCSRLLQAAAGCSRLQQAAAGCSRLLQAAAGCSRPFRIPLLFARAVGTTFHPTLSHGPWHNPWHHPWHTLGTALGTTLWQAKVEAECGQLPMCMIQNKCDLMDRAAMSPAEAEGLVRRPPEPTPRADVPIRCPEPMTRAGVAATRAACAPALTQR